MNLLKLWSAAASLMILAFALYVAAPAVRAKLSRSKAGSTSSAPSIQPPASSAPPQEDAAAKTPKPTPRRENANEYPLANVNNASLSAVPENPNLGGVRSDEGLAKSDPPPSTRVVSLLPGQSINLKNRDFDKVEIHAQFPIQALVANCRQSNVVQAFCQTEPADIFIEDLRRQPLFSAPQANAIIVTMSR